MAMNNTSETKRLAEAVANLAATITEIIDLKVKSLALAARAGEALDHTGSVPPPAEGWAGKKAVAAHLKVSLGTVNAWMRKGLIPHMRLGRSVRFKLGAVDEAMRRRMRGHI